VNEFFYQRQVFYRRSEGKEDTDYAGFHSGLEHGKPQGQPDQDLAERRISV